MPPVSGLLTGQVALVTGAGGGIGRGIALRFAEEGAAAVAVHCRTAVEAASEVAARVRELGARSVVLQADLTDEDACRALVREAAEFGGGRLTALVNNAGVQPTQPLDGMTAAEWRAVVDTNLTSVFACTQAAAEAMRAEGGTVTHIASIEASAPAPLHAHYSASKAAVVMHARSAALEYGPYGIRVNTVSPGLIDREGLAEAWPEGVRRWREAAPTGRLGRPEDVGDACVFLASPLASWVTGHDLVVDGGVSARPTW
ncbi:SDR family NAD(P)-dependent oxidoreductase [Streptomyces hokutonensis]|uniref:SDR family NAD(P)-dependent oxidoreductase n=1 Tax=Streptomyces hokutonensis TaxID=1306990 RepID=UPI0003627E02|nr:SDR family oxidoreductase [Streptomyces hokutonensis]